MKKNIVIGLLIVVIFILLSQNLVSWVKSISASSRNPSYQKRLEFFQKLSLKYYGTSDYGKELETVNSSVKITNLSTHLTELIIPSQDAVSRLKERQTLASTENQPRTRLAMPIVSSSVKEVSTKQTSKEVEHSKSSMLLFVIGLILISAVISLVSYFKYRNRAKNSDLIKFSSDEPLITDDSILIDFDLSNFEEKRKQPNLAYIQSVN